MHLKDRMAEEGDGMEGWELSSTTALPSGLTEASKLEPHLGLPDVQHRQKGLVIFYYFLICIIIELYPSGAAGTVVCTLLQNTATLAVPPHWPTALLFRHVNSTDQIKGEKPKHQYKTMNIFYNYYKQTMQIYVH